MLTKEMDSTGAGYIFWGQGSCVDTPFFGLGKYGNCKRLAFRFWWGDNWVVVDRTVVFDSG
jgi:hypothetical protein